MLVNSPVFCNFFYLDQCVDFPTHIHTHSCNFIFFFYQGRDDKREEAPTAGINRQLTSDLNNTRGQRDILQVLLLSLQEWMDVNKNMRSCK